MAARILQDADGALEEVHARYLFTLVQARCRQRPLGTESVLHQRHTESELGAWLSLRTRTSTSLNALNTAVS